MFPKGEYVLKVAKQKVSFFNLVTTIHILNFVIPLYEVSLKIMTTDPMGPFFNLGGNGF